MKKITLCIFVLITLTSFRADISGPWIKTEKDKIILYTRPENHSKTVSPDLKTIQKILTEQVQVVDYINQKLKVNYDAKIEIYLYNYDEAKEKIGTNGGGFFSPRKPIIYYTYYDKPSLNTIRNTYEYIGVHEMVHLITKYKLGKPKVRFFSEGYANAVDGNYGLVKKDDKFIRQRNDITIKKIKKKGKLLTPTELLYKNDIPEWDYYPQIGCLINWMFKEYGVNKVNRLYTLNERRIEKKFYKITGDTFKEMEIKYAEYQSNI